MSVLPRGLALHGSAYAPLADVGPEWASWCTRWRSTSTLSEKTIDALYKSALRAGRWLARHHPEVSRARSNGGIDSSDRRCRTAGGALDASQSASNATES